ncbi:mycothione reductase [Agilicoccus flavus]|uniref:mycothione reductase n=1 Tax=Agilicoccus flavus TaxID=2775968 RepID=UPI001CF71BB5|nr:mycothione reductase [Agilicoccus flavus]
MDHYDLVILGSGSGNSLVTPDLDGRRVALVEASPVFGGTCLNVGCIPTKMYVYAADVADTTRSAPRYGVSGRVDGVDWPAIRDRIFGRIDPISAGGRAYRETGPNTTLVSGHARFVGPRTLDVALRDGGTAHITGDQVVVATGSRVTVPDVILASGVPFETSDTVMRVPALPASMAILGGGYVAAEFAHVFSALGVRVTVVARGPQLLRHLDGEISRRFTQVAREQWDVRTDTGVTAAHSTPGGVRLTLTDGSDLDVETLLVATGRRPNSDDLGVEAAGLRLHDDGRIVVDEYGRTGVEGVWALGDVVAAEQLKHVANAQARTIAHNLAHPGDLLPFLAAPVPSAVFTHPQIASVGRTQDELDAAGERYTVKVQAYGDTAYGWAMEDTTGVCKVLADPATGAILGAHLMGPQASVIIQPAIQAMSTGQSVRDIVRTQYWIHPALPEVLENALLGLELDD